jgi:dipeptidyl aminopeptidase/acylaminoacyl peptidase
VKTGQNPLWSPTGATVAYVVRAGSTLALRTIPAAGGKSRTLVAHDVQNVFGWSPDGKYVAFEMGTGSTGKLAVVNAATKKVQTLVQLRYAPTAAWAPDSTELVATSVPKTQKCWSTWRVSIGGAKPTLISTCS